MDIPFEEKSSPDLDDPFANLECATKDSKRGKPPTKVERSRVFTILIHFIQLMEFMEFMEFVEFSHFSHPVS